MAPPEPPCKKMPTVCGVSNCVGDVEPMLYDEGRRLWRSLSIEDQYTTTVTPPYDIIFTGEEAVGRANTRVGQTHFWNWNLDNEWSLRMVYISIALSMLSLHMFQPLVANTALRNTMLSATSRGAPFKPRMLL